MTGNARAAATTRWRAGLVALGAFALALFGTPAAHAADGTAATPTDLFNGYQHCSTDPSAPTFLWGGSGVFIEGVAQGTPPSNPTGNGFMTVQYRVWPVADPTQITTVAENFARAGDEAGALVPSDVLADGQTYAWQAQTLSGTSASDWSSTCYFTPDNVRPDQPPTVTSPNYPQNVFNQGGAPVQFTFGANGVGDVAGYEYDWQQDLGVVGVPIGDHGIPQPTDPYSDPKHFVRATTLGGSAAASLIPPGGSGLYRLWVRSLDRAGNPSDETDYMFFVKYDGPTATPLVPTVHFDKVTPFRLMPNPDLQAISPVVSYSVETFGANGQQTTHVDAAGDGSAEVNLTLNGAYGDFFYVSSTSANGWISSSYDWTTGPVDTSPTVSSNVYTENASSGGPDVPGTFTFTPKVKGVASYTYAFNWGTPTTVKAIAGGSAQISWTPPESGWYDLEVYATTKDGIQLAPYDYYFTAN